MDEERFHFSGELLLKKIIKFSCDINVEIKYEKVGNEVRYQARILYNVPVVIEGINSLVTGLIGKDFVSDKIVDFIDNLHLVLEILNQLDSAAWNELVDDQEFLESLVFPISFTSEEISLVLDIIVN